jgi:tetratricopeptide (TPR) repeat protein
MHSVKLVILFFTIGLFSFDKSVQFDDKWSIEELHKKAALFDSLDHDSTLFFGKALLKRSKSEENNLLQAYAHDILGNDHYVRYDMSSAILEYEKAMEKQERFNAPSSHALTLYSLGLAYFNQADYQRSIQYAHRTDSMKPV